MATFPAFDFLECTLDWIFEHELMSLKFEDKVTIDEQYVKKIILPLFPGIFIMFQVNDPQSGI